MRAWGFHSATCSMADDKKPPVPAAQSYTVRTTPSPVRASMPANFCVTR